MLEKGQGGPIDVANAVKYFDPAANYGIAQAQYRLGLLLASDPSKSDSLVAAYKWLVLAEDILKQNDKTTQQLRDLLTPAQLAQAENEIAGWRTAHFPRPNR